MYSHLIKNLIRNCYIKSITLGEKELPHILWCEFNKIATFLVMLRILKIATFRVMPSILKIVTFLVMLSILMIATFLVMLSILKIATFLVMLSILKFATFLVIMSILFSWMKNIQSINYTSFKYLLSPWVSLGQRIQWEYWVYFWQQVHSTLSLSSADV